MFTSKLDECLVMNTPSHLLSSTSIDNPPCTQTTNSNNFTREEYFNPNLTVNESTNVIVLNNDSHHNECVIISQQNDANINGQDDEDNDNLFDDLSAAIEAINEANRLNSTCDDDHDIDEVCGNESVDNSNHISSTIQHHHHHHQQQQQQLQSVPGITTFRTITSTDHFVTHSMFVNISNTCINSTNQLTSFKCNSDELIQTNQNEIPVNHNTGISSCSSTSSIIMPSLLTTSSRPMNTFPLSWRLLLRPIFEKALIERLWTSGELGSSNPHALLLSMWFYISRHFGIGCRTDHAKLAYGNIIIGMNATTGERHLQFTSLPHGAASAGTLRKLSKRGKEFVSPVKPRHPDSLLPEYLSRPDRCPVRLFEAFCSHRPCSSTAIESPFYLQPDRSPSLMHPSTVNNVWFTSNALGKNKIGSMLNGALQSIGIPVGRQVSLARFCDALIAAAFSQPSSGDDENVDGTTDDGDSSNVGGALRNLLLVNCQSNKQIPESLQPIIAMYAENIVQMSRTPGSSVYVYLAKICEMQKALGKKRKADTRLSKISSKFLFTTSTTTTNDDDDDDDDEDVEDDDGNGDINHTNNVDDNHSIDFTRNLPVTTDNINHGTSGAMNVNYLKASPSLPTLTSGNLCIDSKQAGICYSDNHSMDDEDDDVGIDLFDLDHSDSSLNNPGDGMLEMQQHQIHHHHHQQQQQQIHKDQIRTGIGTTNDGDDDEMKQEMNCLTKVKLSPSQVDMNLGISQTYPFGDIMQTHGQTLFDVTSGQLFQLQQQQNPQQQLNDSSELLFTSSLSCANSVNSGTVGSVNISSPAVLFVPATYTTAAHNRIELNTAGAAPASSASSNLITGSSISAALPLDENMIDISRLGGIDSLMPTTMISSSISLKQSSPVNVSSQCLQSNLKHEITNQNGDIVYNQSNDDIRIDLRKTGGGSGRSVKLELRELLDLVLAASARTPNPLVLADSGKIYTHILAHHNVLQLVWLLSYFGAHVHWMIVDRGF
ncbi:unnamed protein product [Heterobilharzia americana]|nr:unnamed protein product [Heterobilharzia americana]